MSSKSVVAALVLVGLFGALSSAGASAMTWSEAEEIYSVGNADDELYDLETDPGEMNNIANHSEHQNRVASMRGQIIDMICQTGPGPYKWCMLEKDKSNLGRTRDTGEYR